MKLVDIPGEIRVCRNLAGAEWVAARSGRVRDVISPYTGAVVARVQMSGSEDVAVVVERAKAAFPGWSSESIKDRTQRMFRFRELMLRDLDKLSHAAAREAGKTVDEARAGILKGIEVTEFALSLQNADSGGRMEVSKGVWCQYKREPLGIVAGITPFNFPAMVPLWMFPIAITLGNCFVLKTSEKVPTASSLMGELMLEAGFPPGVFSLVNGDKEAVEALVSHPDIKAVGFVGSTAAAKAVYTLATSQGKRALCLGGAKNHLIVVPDADEAITVKGVVDSFTGCAGQRCMAASVMLAVGDVEPIITKIKEEASKRTLGSVMGAIIDTTSKDRITTAIGNAEKDGAKILLDGRNATSPSGYEKGTWLAPTIIDKALPDMECAKSEIFGPVLTIIRVPSLSEAMKIEGQSGYGNATSVFTTSGAVSSYVTENATSGMVGINVGVPVPREPFSFGGTKDSKFGHGDITGESSLDFWTNLKKITSKWTAQSEKSLNKKNDSANWMS